MNKKNLLRKIFILLPVLLVVISGLFLFGVKKSLAEEIFAEVNYISVYQAKYESNTYTKIGNDTFENNNTFLLSQSEAVVIEFEKEKLILDEINGSYKVSNIQTQFVINGSLMSTTLENNGITTISEQDNEIFKCTISNVNNSSNFIYGNYQIKLTYWYIDDDYNSQQKVITLNFNILNKSDYSSKDFSNTYQNGSVDNNTAHYFNYNAQGVATLTINPNNYNIYIQKNHQQLNTTTSFVTNTSGEFSVSSYDNNSVSTNEHYVLYYTEKDALGKITQLKIMFKDLGTYYITYEPINQYFNYQPVSNFYNTPNDKSPATGNTVYVYGYQAYYTTNEGLKEFKHIENDKILQQADITYDVYATNTLIPDISNLTPVKSNQAPIYFKTNAISNELKKHYYYYSSTKIDTIPTEGTQYLGTPLTEVGYYVVWFNYISPLLEEKTQYFYFEITNTTPFVEIKETESENEISNDSFTKENVLITKYSNENVFDSKSKLSVYIASNYDNNYKLVTEDVENEQIFEQNGKYKVVLSYGNNFQKNYISYFSIDKTEISGIEINEVMQYANNYYKNVNLLNNKFYTNSDISISWDEKTSKARTYAEYKYFPTNYSSKLDNISSSEIKEYYKSAFSNIRYGILTSHSFSLSEGNYPISMYENTKNNISLNEEHILSNSGLYIFRIYDDCLNEKYFYVFIDKTPNNVLLDNNTKDNNEDNASEWSYINSSILTSEDLGVYFGKYKLIKFENVINSYDSWLSEIFINNSDLKNEYIYEYQGHYYLKVPTYSTVQFIQNGVQKQLTLNDSNNYGIVLNQKGNDTQYIFYSLSNSLSNIKNNLEFFAENSENKVFVNFTTDETKMTVNLNDINNPSLELNTNHTLQDSKKFYYEPVSKTALENSNEKLIFSYNLDLRENLTIESINLDFYAFEKNQDNSNNIKSYSYKFNSNPTTSILIYQKGGINLGKLSNNVYSWEVNLEAYDSSNNTRTRAGKYVITRTYSDDSILKEEDPKLRTLTFIVDRNGIISQPELDKNNKQQYYTGSAIMLQVLNSSNSITDSTLFYDDIYYANKTQLDSQFNPILTTNLSPVVVYIPTYKYGYISSLKNNDNENLSYYKFNPENSIISYQDVNASGRNETYYYDGFSLSATVYFVKNSSESFKYSNKITKLNIPTKYGFMNNSNNDTLLTFNEIGCYRVEVKSGNGDVFYFDFKVEANKPEFNLTDTSGNKFNNSFNKNDITYYYTNKDTIRISWEQQDNKFLGTIDKNNIKLTLNNQTVNVVADNSKNYVDVKLSDYGFYSHGNEIKITLQFVGDSKAVTTQGVYLDLQAPTTNISNIIKNAGLENYEHLLRNSQDSRYNTSQHTGVLQYFTYTLDYEGFKNMIKLETDVSEKDYCKTYYKVYSNKYLIGNVQETDITLDNNFFTGLISDLNTDIVNGVIENSYLYNFYIEVIEEDFAGNRTVYSVILTKDIFNNANGLDLPIFEVNYTNNKNLNNSDIFYLNENDLTQGTNGYTSRLNSIYSFNLNNIKYNLDAGINLYYLVKINDEIYVNSPYNTEKYYKLEDFKDFETSTKYNLVDISKLSASDKNQDILIYNVSKYGNITLSVYVLNKALEFKSLSEYKNSLEYEGIAIKLPKEGHTNPIYPTNLLISSHITGVNINPIEINLFNNLDNINQETIKALNETYNNISNNNSYNITFALENTLTEKYLLIEFKSNYLKSNNYFIYIVKDNFDETGILNHIYGQMEITNPIKAENGIIIEGYNNNLEYTYYSSNVITFKYNSILYTKADIIINGNTFEIDTSIIPSQKPDANKFLEVTIENDIVIIKLKPEIIDFSKNSYGGVRNFKVNLYLNKDFKENKIQTIDETYYFTIFNKIPKFSLINEDGIDITSIIGQSLTSSKNATLNYFDEDLGYPFEIRVVNPELESIKLTESFTTTINGQYRIIIDYLGYIKGLNVILDFEINDSADFKYSVVKINDDGTKTEINPTGSAFSYSDGITKSYIDTHYIVNGDYDIIVNKSINLTKEEGKQNVGMYTKIYNIYPDYSNPSDFNTTFYSIQIAITKIPETITLLSTSDFVQIDSAGTNASLTKNNSTSITASTSTKESYDLGKKIAWKKYHLIPENKIIPTVYYNEIGREIYPEITEINDMYVINLVKSGIYYIKFSDLAGNTHYFGSSKHTEYYTIKYVSSVIFEINDDTPINYAVYNDDVKISIPQNTLNYYDSNAKPTIYVELNGKMHLIETNNTYEWHFSEKGLYKVWFSTKIGGEVVYEYPTYFTILSANESKTNFYYNSTENYYIEEVKLNGKSVYSKLNNINNGDQILVNNKYFLKELNLSLNDVKTGAGIWDITINTNNEFNQKFSFTVWLNSAKIPLIISHKNGSKTTKTIKINFLTENLLAQAGDCIIKITGEKNLYITKDLFNQGKLQSSYEFKLTEPYTYYIEVITVSGFLLYSSCIEKTEPLNSISIVIIVVASLLVIAGTVVFIRLRKKLKVK